MAAMPNGSDIDNAILSRLPAHEFGLLRARAESGRQVQIATIGRDGLIGAAVILNITHPPYTIVVDMESHGYAVPAAAFLECFHSMEVLRRVSLEFLGTLLLEVARSVACNRFHGYRQRLARWLLVTVRTSGHLSLDLTHEFIAQMVGGPRHAVTAALHDLRNFGGITYGRGRIDVVDVSRLAACACECYRNDPTHLNGASDSTAESDVHDCTDRGLLA